MSKAAVAGISLILVVGVVIGTIATVSRGGSKNAEPGSISTGMKAVDTLCAPADYKDACINTLAPVAQKNKDATPKDLVHAAVTSIRDTVNNAFDKTTEMEKDADEKTKEKLNGCKQLFGYSMYDLESALTKLVDKEVHSVDELSYDLKNLLGAVMAYNSDCVEFLESTQPELAKSLNDPLTNTTHLSLNALAIVDTVASVLGKIKTALPADLTSKSRRLLTDGNNVDKEGYPTWFSASDRKLLQARPNNIRPDVVVAQDGSGQFKSIQEAINAAPANNPNRHIIYVKAGIYREQVEVPSKVINLFMYGDGPRRTIVTGHKNKALEGVGTWLTATFAAVGNGFIVKSMGFQNTAGPAGEQAVAFRTQSDCAVMYNCRFDGYQDTLYYQSKRSFFRNCVISGTVDFIFGKGSAVIQNSKIILRAPGKGQLNTVTADGRMAPREVSGLVIQNCHIVPEVKLEPLKATVPSYLGRPWQAFARTMIMESVISDHIRPEGWYPFQGTNNQETSDLKEYANRGLGANTSGRVRWRSVQIVTDKKVAEEYTPGRFLGLEQWIKSAGVPYFAGFAH